MNLKRFAGYALYVIALVVLLNACEGCDYGGYKPMPAEFKSYTVFSKGSYWIYKDSASALLDSINEYDANYEKSSHGGPDFEYGHDAWTFYYNSSQQSIKSFQRQITMRENVRVFESFYLYVYTEDTQTGDHQFYPVYFAADTLKSTWEYGYNDGVGIVEITYKELIPSMTIGSNVFTDVKMFEHNRLLNGSPNTLTRRIYVAKNVGIIRRELFNGEVWELQKYFINN